MPCTAKTPADECGRFRMERRSAAQGTRICIDSSSVPLGWRGSGRCLGFAKHAERHPGFWGFDVLVWLPGPTGVTLAQG